MRFQYRLGEKASRFFGQPAHELTTAQWLLVAAIEEVEIEPPPNPNRKLIGRYRVGREG